jgi:flagellar hook-length control protein FliK
LAVRHGPVLDHRPVGDDREPSVGARAETSPGWPLPSNGAAGPAAGTPADAGGLGGAAPVAGDVGAPPALPGQVAAETAALAPHPGHAAPPATPEPPTPPVPQVVPHPTGGQVTARLVRHDTDGGERLTIELDPVGLGPVEVALRLDDQGAATALFTVDRPETLQLLQRDARTLIELLSAAGFTLDPGSLGFSLRDDGHAGDRPRRQAATEPRWPSPEPEGSAPPGHHAPASRGLLDLRV